MNLAKACWRSFGDWLEGGTPGGLPVTLRLWLGPVWCFVPQARQVAVALDPWLVALLEARQRAGLAGQGAWEVLQRDLEARPLTRREAAQIGTAWAGWRLEAEFLRLVRLVEAPTDWFSRSGSPEWEVRYWALVIALARVGQHYAVLACQPEGNPAERLRACAEMLWQHATASEPVPA
jgi:hypothetical protein